jgi:hypothetical protein
MTAMQEYSKKLEVEASDHERSILLVDIMNAIGFSKNEREIHIYTTHLRNRLKTNWRTTDNCEILITGSTSEGMCGGMYNTKRKHDCDLLYTARHIKLYTPRTNNTDNPPPLLLHGNEDYHASFFVEEDDNFPGYVKLSLAEVKTNCVYLDHCRRMNDGKLYLSSYMVMDSFGKGLVKSSNGFMPFLFSDSCQEWNKNGPAQSVQRLDHSGYTREIDDVFCIHYDTWPNLVNSFITRRKPNNWPSNRTLENIQRQGCDVAPVGHHDSKNNDVQWRISFPGERNLLFDLNDVQILCYALMKIILRENLNTFQREVVSSFHIKQVIFWCVELCSCAWVYSNYINCLNICLTKLIQMIKARHIPHYIIESRNLLNSKMTEQMSKEIVDVLSKYDVTHVFTLDAFECVFELTHYNNALLKRASFKSTIMASFFSCFDAFSVYVKVPSLLWDSYIPHNVTTSLLNYKNFLHNFKNVKGVNYHYVKYIVRSVVGFLYYAKYKESNKTDFFLASKRLIHKSLNLDNSCVHLRAATFFLTNREFRQSIEICDTFLTSPPRHKMKCESTEYISDMLINYFDQMLEWNTTEEIENIMKAILPMFFSSFKLKSLPGNYDITQQNPVWKFRNLTNIFFRDLYIDVTFMTAEKWVVPDPIQYELLSLRQVANNEESPFLGIHLDPMFACLQTKFLCCHSIGNINGMAGMLTLMNSFITETTCTTKLSYVYLNMFAYCQIKAGHNRQSVKSILQSLRIFPSRYNAASGYLKIALQILSSFSVLNG